MPRLAQDAASASTAVLVTSIRIKYLQRC